MAPLTVNAAVVANPLCPAETALYDPGFASGLNFPTGIPFRATSGGNFEVYVLESGHGLPAGQSGPDTKVKNAADGPLLQIPGTGTVFRICRSGE